MRYDSKKNSASVDAIAAPAMRFQRTLEPGNYQVKITFSVPIPNSLTIGVENVPTQRFRSTEKYDNHIIKGTITQGASGEIVFDVAVIDGVFDLEFIGDTRGGVQFETFANNIEISRLPAKTRSPKPTVYIMGDSTVASYAATDIMAGWGQKLGKLLGSHINVDNRAIGGRSTRSFYREGRLEEVLLSLKPGDLALVQFGHNDGSHNKDERYVSNQDYEMLLTDYYIKGVKQRGGIPVIVTPVPRHGFRSATTHDSYVASAKKAARLGGAFLIDAHNLALSHYNSLPGTETEKQVVLDSYYILDKKGSSDHTHFTKAGAAKMAEIIYSELARLKLV